VAGEDSEGEAEVEPVLRPGRLRQQVTCWGVGLCRSAASWPCTDPWPAPFDAGPQVARAARGEEEGGAEVEPVPVRPWRLRQQVTCWGVGLCRSAASWPCTDRDPWPAHFDTGPQVPVAGEDSEEGAEVEPVLRPGRLRQQVTCWGVGLCHSAASWPCTDPWPARFDAGPQVPVAGEDSEEGAEVEPVLRPWRLRQQVTCWGVGLCRSAASWPCTDPWPAHFDAGPQVARAARGEEEGGAELEPVPVRPGRLRQQVTCRVVRLCGILALY
jgi:hypothetical protein